MAPTRLYVGNLPKERPVERNELEEKFEKFGRVVDIWVARQPPGFAFVTMDDENEANEAVKELDGSKVGGERIRVEVSKGGGLGVAHLHDAAGVAAGGEGEAAAAEEGGELLATPTTPTRIPDRPHVDARGVKGIRPCSSGPMRVQNIPAHKVRTT
eukprot:CAMPEP_0181457630 /NCGR_PEP_ID=MMETSP1110-20121109/31885_1 /TAXON_ID=174948 /ORGANISM="Symbiodinium sp., Strain CCMP421" /LENGTH=155 /DNA_ID=CAMNT_0023582077 /DNA_START=184 /DNA_END=652 /DNA_ORIENTATION=+